MALQIARLTGLNEPNEWHATGDVVNLRGSYKSSGAQWDGFVRREQLLGLVDNPDEPVVPLIIDNGDPRVNGYYRVTRVLVPEDEFTRKQTNLFDYEIDLERVAPIKSCYIESYLNGAVRSTGVVLTAQGKPNVCTPQQAIGFTAIPGNGGANWTRQSADPNMPGGAKGLIFNYGIAYKTTAFWAQPLAAYYYGACTITNPDPFAHVVMGQHDAPPPDNWTLSNGLVQVSATPGNSYFTITGADQTNTYRSSTKYYLHLVGYVTDVTPAAALNFGMGGARIIRNSPEEVILRIPCTVVAAAASLGQVQVDIWLRRGSRIVRFYMTYPYENGDTVLHGFWTPPGVAGATSFNNSLLSAADANNNQWQLTTAQAVTTFDTANMRETTTNPARAFDGGIWLVPNGATGLTNYDGPQRQSEEYFTAQSERQQLVVR